MGLEGTRDMLVGESDLIAPAIGAPLCDCWMLRAATRSAREAEPLGLVGETGASAMVTDTIGVIANFEDMSAEGLVMVASRSRQDMIAE